VDDDVLGPSTSDVEVIPDTDDEGEYGDTVEDPIDVDVVDENQPNLLMDSEDEVDVDDPDIAPGPSDSMDVDRPIDPVPTPSQQTLESCSVQ
jgi:hypothetical protein